MQSEREHLQVFISYANHDVREQSGFRQQVVRELEHHEFRPSDESNRNEGFQVSEESAIHEIGTSGIEELCRLQHFLYGRESTPPLRFRLAPSIVARSEAELFGMSIPRFAVRVYLDEGGESFINARRLILFSKEARSRAPKSPKVLQSLTGVCWHPTPLEEIDSPSDALATASCIGDSLLVPPPRLSDVFHCLTVELGRAYGEGRSIRGTPFVRDFPFFGGGLCAQAVCFMATALRHDDRTIRDTHRSIVYSPAEVSFVAAREDSTTLILSPLTPSSVTHFLRHATGGTAEWQSSFGSTENDADMLRLSGVLRAYLLAGMPVIVSTSLARLANGKSENQPSIYGSNGLSVAVTSDREAGEQRMNHVVLLVGCGRAPHNADRFLINDPATYPFLQADIRQLRWAAASPDPNAPGSFRCMFLPVTPPSIRASLETWRDDQGRVHAGLLNYAETFVRRLAEGCSGALKGLGAMAGESGVGIWLLRLADFNCDDANSSGENIVRCILSATRMESTAILRSIAAAADFRDYGDHWIWVQHRRAEDDTQSLWIWDAERDVPSGVSFGETSNIQDEQLLGVPLAVVRCGNGVWTHSWVSKPNRRASFSISAYRELDAKTRRPSAALRPALITSFMPERVLGFWPSGVACELNLMLCLRSALRDSATESDRTSNLTDTPMVELLAQLAEDPERLHRLAGSFAKWAEPRSVEIVAISTSIPEITDPDVRRGSTAQRALLAAVNLARVLQEFGHPTTVVELVGGSRIQGIWPYRRSQTSTFERYIDGYAATVHSTRTAINVLCHRLRSVVQLMGRTRQHNRSISLALELEPGPLFALNNLDGLLHAYESIERDPELSSTVGFNLDVAHYTLAGITPSALSPVSNRIVHCHLSDQGRGHFGDCPIGDVGLGESGLIFQERLDTFRPWIRLLLEVAAAARNRNTVKSSYSGYVSLELEGCRSKEMVEASVKNLCGLILSECQPSSSPDNENALRRSR